LLSQNEVDIAIDRADAGGHVSERVQAMTRALADLSAQTLPLGRSLIRLTVDSPGENIEQPKRGYRRIARIERAIAPLRSELDEAAFERLVSALAMVVGWEALIVVLQDLRGLPTDEQTRVSIWAARALIQAALDDQASQLTSTPATANPATRAGDADRDSQTD
jgi:hypothetical protein